MVWLSFQAFYRSNPVKAPSSQGDWPHNLNGAQEVISARASRDHGGRGHQGIPTKMSNATTGEHHRWADECCGGRVGRMEYSRPSWSKTSIEKFYGTLKFYHTNTWSICFMKYWQLHIILTWKAWTIPFPLWLSEVTHIPEDVYILYNP